MRCCLLDEEANIKIKYFRKYEELRCLLERAYVDIYSLEEIENYNKSAQNDGYFLTNSSFRVLGHISELLKTDLGLTICKVYTDDGKVNTIKKLSTYIHQNCSNIVDVSSLPKMGLSQELCKVESHLTKLRNSFLAHNDDKKTHTSIQLAEMVSVVEELRRKLNRLCFVDLDSRATEITDQNLQSIKLDVSFGLGMMIHRSTFPLSKEQQD